MTIRNIQEAETALEPYVPLVTQLTGKDTVLDRVWPLMELAGNPQDRLKVIHIAGTSGKTSTSYYMNALLTATGYKTGLTVSPHVDSVAERVQINGRPLPEKKFCACLAEFLSIVEKAEQKPSYFELLYAFALWVFEKEGVDYAVAETGLGGLHDATNVARRPDKLCILTDIGMDHMLVLGNTLKEIAFQKAGIIHKGNVVFTYRQVDEVMDVYHKQVQEKGAELHVVADYQPRDMDIPDYQQRNWNLAYQAYLYLKQRDGIRNLSTEELRQTQHARVPARMEIRQVNGKTLIMDGAHNLQKMEAFLHSFKRLYSGVKPAVLIALKQGKDYQDIVPLLEPVASRVIVTTFRTTQDLPVISMDPQVLGAAFTEAGAEVQIVPDQHKALQALLDGPEKTCVITGSFYLLSQMRHNEHLLGS